MITNSREGREGETEGEWEWDRKTRFRTSFKLVLIFFFFLFCLLIEAKKIEEEAHAFAFLCSKVDVCVCTLIDLTDWPGLKTRLSLPLLFSLLFWSILFVVCKLWRKEVLWDEPQWGGGLVVTSCGWLAGCLVSWLVGLVFDDFASLLIMMKAMNVIIRCQSSCRSKQKRKGSRSGSMPPNHFALLSVVVAVAVLVGGGDTGGNNTRSSLSFFFFRSVLGICSSALL